MDKGGGSSPESWKCSSYDFSLRIPCLLAGTGDSAKTLVCMLGVQRGPRVFFIGLVAPWGAP